MYYYGRINRHNNPYYYATHRAQYHDLSEDLYKVVRTGDFVRISWLVLDATGDLVEGEVIEEYTAQ